MLSDEKLVRAIVSIMQEHHKVASAERSAAEWEPFAVYLLEALHRVAPVVELQVLVAKAEGRLAVQPPAYKAIARDALKLYRSQMASNIGR